jgi:virginiamycin B lyase
MMVSVILTISVTLTVGCSSSGSGTAIPVGGAVQSSASLPTPERVRIKEFADLPQYSTYYSPTAIAQDAGSMWVTDTIDQDAGANAVVQIAPSGKQQNVFYAYGTTSGGTDLSDITAGPDGALWLADGFNWRVLRMTTQGQFTPYPLGENTRPLNITTGPDKAVWFTWESPVRGAGIGRITTTGKTRFYHVYPPLDIATGSDGALWFTQPGANEIGRVTIHGKFTEFSKGISSGSQPQSIAPGPDGALWFTELKGGRIGRITTAGSVSEYSRGITSGEQPIDLAAGSDGAMWFTEYEGYSSYGVIASKIGRITMNGTITEYTKNLNPLAGPTGIAAGPGRAMFFVEDTDETGRVRL